MLKNFMFDMDGTLIDCKAEEFVPLYKNALLAKFANETKCKEIVKTVLTGAGIMVKNDGSQTNREMFMAFARKSLAMTPERLEELMTDFYANEYVAIKSAILVKPEIVEAVKILKAKGYRLIVSTNPLFPVSALEKRLEWGGHDRADFDFVTSYETSTYAKPSVGYYTETLRRLSLDPSETMIIGNDMDEDIAAGKKAGMKTYWLTDSPIKSNSLVQPDYEGKSAELIAFVNSL